MSILKQAEAGTPAPNLCREHGMSSATFYKWKSKYGCMDLSMMTRLKELEAENARLKRMYADERLKSDVLQDTLSKKFKSLFSVSLFLSKLLSNLRFQSAWPA